jgi:hypothetical protein
MGAKVQNGQPDEAAAESESGGADRVEADRDRYLADLISRGEAVPEGEQLPSGATHEVTVDEHGDTAVRRRRFTIG